MAYAIIWAVFSLGLLGIQVWLSYVRQTLSPGQMAESGLLPGVPFLGHGGMWGDLVIITPLLYFILDRDGSLWSFWQVLVCMAIGAVASFLMHESYKGDNFPGAHVLDHKLIGAGWVHMLYMAVAIGILLLFYLFTKGEEPWFVWTSTGLLIAHVIIGTHVPMKIIAPWWFAPLPVFDLPTVATIAGSSILVVSASFWALR